MVELENRDLTAEDNLGTGTGANPIGLAQFRGLLPDRPSVQPFNLVEKQEWVRGRIAQGLVLLLAIIIALAFLTLWLFSASFQDLEKLMTLIYAPVVALVGSAVGYYFGGKSHGTESR